jgi:hypothetical protein
MRALLARTKTRLLHLPLLKFNRHVSQTVSHRSQSRADFFEAVLHPFYDLTRQPLYI